MKTFGCKCGATVDYPCQPHTAYNVGEVIDATGWGWLPATDGGSIWVCPLCYEKSRILAREIISIFGRDDFRRTETEKNSLKILLTFSFLRVIL